jgi:hypothetical protein
MQHANAFVLARTWQIRKDHMAFAEKRTDGVRWDGIA